MDYVSALNLRIKYAMQAKRLKPHEEIPTAQELDNLLPGTGEAIDTSNASAKTLKRPQTTPQRMMSEHERRRCRLEVQKANGGGIVGLCKQHGKWTAIYRGQVIARTMRAVSAAQIYNRHVRRRDGIHSVFCDIEAAREIDKRNGLN
ncbi:hypothetical protein UFOVP1622_29 [uncultured Caudovirales phage]|uniref:Uncharacterized protein n=1 Tax=uncultured Caudovirales phage TaxID=2100421 RepID=A0A6J5SYH5_9CAUD|nr:hypothetical protein UFOVP1021_8 [uncultured Caudovirales phage]CAB4219711.1 hypothetical protein UFOVP1622_29 [uncultured Caudovirales phage]